MRDQYQVTLVTLSMSGEVGESEKGLDTRTIIVALSRAFEGEIRRQMTKKNG